MQNKTTSPGALLVVDSDSRVRSAIIALLKVALPDLSVVEAITSTEALEFLRTTSFGVILVDAAQPSPERYPSLIAHLRSKTGSVIIGMGTRRHHRYAAHAAGAHEFISKAASADVLLPVISWAYGNGATPKPAT